LKALAYILALYFVTLTLIPCQDNHAIAATSNTASAHMHESPGNESRSTAEHGHKDNCSPLCVCGCCSIAMNMTEHLDFSFDQLAQHQDKPQEYHRFVFLDTYFNIWQPPKLA
jgi:hypothetical protein